MPSWTSALYVNADAQERARQDSVTAYGLSRPPQLWTADEEPSAHVRSAQAMLTGCVTALSIVDADRIVSISAQPACPPVLSPRASGLAEAVLQAAGDQDVFVTGDARAEPALADHPMVTGRTGSVRFCAGAVLLGRDGLPLGVLQAHSAEVGTAHAAELAVSVLSEVRDAIIATLDRRRFGGSVSGSPHAAEAPAAQISAAAIATVLDDCAIQTLFQPIVHLPTGQVVGFEALSRGPVGTDLESPMALLAAARRSGRLGELDWLCRTNAMRLASRSGLPPSLSWFINVEPAGLEQECPAHLRPALERARMALRVCSRSSSAMCTGTSRACCGPPTRPEPMPGEWRWTTWAPSSRRWLCCRSSIRTS